MPNPSEPQTSAASSALYDPAELTSENWERAAARLLAKMIGEFAYEEIIEPKREPEPELDHGPGSAPAHGPGPRPGWSDLYTLPVEGSHMPPGGAFRFKARRGAYGSWLVDPGSIQWIAGRADESAGRPDETVGRPAESVDRPDKTADRPGGTVGRPAQTDKDADAAEPRPSLPATNPPERFTDPLAFLLRAKHVLDLDGATLGHLIRELTVTLAADARLDHTALTAAQLAELGYAELEGHQTGHPWLVLNKGRMGFSASDAARWAPEARIHGTLPWIAVHTRIAAYRGVADLATSDRLYDRELSPAARDSFAEALRERGLDPQAYLYLPVHPWQWNNIVLPLFAGPVATDAIVPLPTDGDVRLPQQSIRTFLNISRPDRHTVKLPLSVLNTLVWRGLPTERTLAAPSVTAWMHSLRETDPFLRDDCGVILLGEVASVAVEHPAYDGLDEVPYQYKELLGAIWREPVSRYLAPGERARTLASLLHVDPHGRAFTAELVARSGLTPEVWLRRLFAALLPRFCTSSTATAPCSPRTGRTPSSSSTTTTCRCGSR